MRFWWVWVMAALLGVSLFVKYYEDTRAEAMLHMTISREAAKASADAILKAHGEREPAGYASAMIMEGCEPLYLKETFGMKKTREILDTGVIPCFDWTVRYFKEKQFLGYQISLNVQTGALSHFTRTLATEAVGKDLAQEQALALAEGYLINQGVDRGQLRLVDKSLQKMKARTDHRFVWETVETSFGETRLRYLVVIQGDTPGEFNRFLQRPEEFSKKYARKQAWVGLINFIVDMVKWGVNCALVFFLFVQYKHGLLRLRSALVMASLVVVAQIVGRLNEHVHVWFFRDVWQDILDFFLVTWGGEVGKALSEGFPVFLFFIVGLSLTRALGKDPIPVVTAFLQKRVGRSFMGERLVVGYSSGLLYLGFITLFSLLGMMCDPLRWKPFASIFASVFRMEIPALYLFTYALQDQIQDNVFYFIFFVPLLVRLLRVPVWVGIFLCAIFTTMNDGFLSVRPYYLRFFESVLAGLFWGWIYWRYGMETLLLARTTFLGVLMIMLFSRSQVPFFQSQAWLITGLLMLPILLLFWTSSRQDNGLASEGA